MMAINHFTPPAPASLFTYHQPPAIDVEYVDDDVSMPDNSVALSREAVKAIEAIEYITEHLKQDDEYKKVTIFYIHFLRTPVSRI